MNNLICGRHEKTISQAQRKKKGVCPGEREEEEIPIMSLSSYQT